MFTPHRFYSAYKVLNIGLSVCLPVVLAASPTFRGQSGAFWRNYTYIHSSITTKHSPAEDKQRVRSGVSIVMSFFEKLCKTSCLLEILFWFIFFFFYFCFPSCCSIVSSSVLCNYRTNLSIFCDYPSIHFCPTQRQMRQTTCLLTFTPTVNSELTFNLTCMFLNRGRRSEKIHKCTWIFSDFYLSNSKAKICNRKSISKLLLFT